MQTCHVWSWSFENRWLTGTIVPVTFIRPLLFLGIWCYVNITQDSTTTQHMGVCSKPKNTAISTTQGSPGDLVTADWKVRKADRALVAGISYAERDNSPHPLCQAVSTLLFGMVLCEVRAHCKECSVTQLLKGKCFLISMFVLFLVSSYHVPWAAGPWSLEL